VGREAAAEDADSRHAWSLPHADFAHLLAAERPDLCVNAAGRASVPASMVEPVADFEGSAFLTMRILDDIRRHSPATAFIHLSSAAVYGEPRSLPITESAEIAPISPYGWHKRLSEMVVEEFAQQFRLRAASLRIFSAYGPRLHRQVVWDLAKRALANPGQPLTVQGQAEDSRDFVHGDDVALAIDAVASKGRLQGESYNLAAGAETRIADLAAMILKAAGEPAEVRFDAERRPGNPSRWHADVARLRSLGFKPSVDLADGVRQVVEAARAAGG
jgi:UDP-glucose 4-epimerase